MISGAQSKNRGRDITKAAKLWRLFQNKKWVSIVDVVEELECCDKTARRWIQSVSEAGWPLSEDNDGPRRFFTILK